MCRSIWKMPFVKYYFLNKKFNNNEMKIYFTRNRSSMILNNFIKKKKFSIYSGKEFITTIKINKNMLGCKLGEFFF